MELISCQDDVDITELTNDVSGGDKFYEEI
jgi:hypothetical protein